jgi:hypothetical protein
MAGHAPAPAEAPWTPSVVAAPVPGVPGYRIGLRANRRKPTGLIVAAGAVAVAAVISGVVFASGDSQAKKPAAVQTSSQVPSASASPVDPQVVNLLPKVSYRCDSAYRSKPTCVPLKFPKGTRSARAKCRWLAKHGVKKIVVRGRDRHHLDKDKNGIGCDR